MIYVILILFAVYNGLIIQWFNNKNKPEQSEYSLVWHVVGWFIRLFLISLLPIKFIPLGIFFGWSVYNFLINIVLDKPLYHIGTTNFDKYLTRNTQIIIDVVLLIGSILTILFY
jgi:hypothetical protein